MSSTISVFVISPDTRSERRFNLHITVGQLKVAYFVLPKLLKTTCSEGYLSPKPDGKNVCRPKGLYDVEMDQDEDLIFVLDILNSGGALDMSYAMSVCCGEHCCSWEFQSLSFR